MVDVQRHLDTVTGEDHADREVARYAAMLRRRGLAGRYRVRRRRAGVAECGTPVFEIVLTAPVSCSATA